MSFLLKPFQRLRVLETHQLPALVPRLLGDALLVGVGLLVWFALPLGRPGHFALAAAAACLAPVGLLLASGRNARIVRWDNGPG